MVMQIKMVLLLEMLVVFNGGGTTTGGTTTTTWSVVDANGGDTDGDGICGDNEVPGCTTVGDCAYDSTATDDDGSCSNLSAGACESCTQSTVSSCTDLSGWVDSLDYDCSGWAGYSQSQAESLASLFAVNGVSALDACCQFGGGSTSTTTGWVLVDVDGGDADGNGICENNEAVDCKWFMVRLWDLVVKFLWWWYTRPLHIQ